MPKNVAIQWQNLHKDLQSTFFEIPRWLGYSSSSLAVELHGFSDASQQALDAVIYLRVIEDFDNIHVSLITAKSKVSPIKKTTIPRLELSAAVLLVRLINKTKKALGFQNIPMHLLP